MKKTLLLLLFILSTFNFQLSTLMAQDYRDVVFLKNGSVIKGFYKELCPHDTLRMETLDGGMLVCPMSDVVRIAKEKVDVYVIKEQDTAPKRTWRPRGYRGFVEYSYGLNIENSDYSVSGVTTIHGYQFNRNVFLGLGIQLDKYTMKFQGYDVNPSTDNLPIFANGRLYLLRSRITPYVDVRAGYNVIGYHGPLASGAVGADFGLTPRTGFSVSLGYQILRYNDDVDGMTNANYLLLKVGFHF